MGQSQSGEPDDNSCFRACIRDKKTNTLKRPAAPLTPNYQTNNESPLFLEPPQTPEKKKAEPSPSHKPMAATREGQTSLQQRLHESVGKLGQLGPGQQKQVCEGVQDEQANMLGLVSKFSSSRKTTLTKHRSPTKITTVSEGLGTRSNWQKENGESQQTSSKSQGVSTESTRSRKVLLNKIEHLKQKYYERELEIEIYQNENEYQEQLDEEKKNNELSEGSREGGSKGRQESVRGKILDKLNKRKMMKLQEKNIKKTKKEEESIVHQELELFSREGLQPDPEESAHMPEPVANQLQPTDKPTPKEDKLNLSKRSLNRSQDVSVDERIEFSGYSQNDTLQEIKECDQEEEDYKSKVESRARSSQVSKAKVLSRRVVPVEEKEEERREMEGSGGSGANRDKILLF